MTSSIMMTYDYSLLKLHPANRHVEDGYVVDMAARMNRKFLLSSFPIVVDSDLYIMDGQTRYSAAKYLQKPIYYIVDHSIKIEDVAMINHNRKWSITDYIHSYASLGKPAYQALQNRMNMIINGYKVTPSTAILFSLQSSTRAGYSKDIKNGRLFINSEEEYTRLIGYAFDIYQALECTPSEYVSRGLIQIIKHPKYSHEHMMHKINNVKMPSRFVPLFSTKGNKEQFIEMYNFKSRKDQVVDFNEE